MMIRFTLIFLALISFIACKKEPPDAPIVTQDVISRFEHDFVFTSDQDGKIEVWQSVNNELSKLTDDLESDSWWPRISFDRTRILFNRSPSARGFNDFENCAIWIKNLQTTQEWKLIDPQEQGWKMVGSANWSPNGKQIVMPALDSTLNRWQIFTVSDTGGAPIRISIRDDVDYLDPVFDHSGDFIYCSILPDGEPSVSDNFEIFKIDITNGEETRLTNNTSRDHHPCPSPDGSKLTFESLTDQHYLQIGKWSIVELDLNSMAQSILVEDEHLNLYPRYSGDGKYVFYIKLDIGDFTTNAYNINLVNDEEVKVSDSTFNVMSIDPF